MKLTFWPCHRACRILVPQPGDEPAPLAKCRVQTTGPPGNSSEWMKSVSVCGAIRAEAKNRVWDSCGGGVKRRPQSHGRSRRGTVMSKEGHRRAWCPGALKEKNLKPSGVVRCQTGGLEKEAVVFRCLIGTGDL